MGNAISQVLPYAVGVAISPLPIIAVILVLFSSRARVNGPCFLAGWIVGVGVVSVVAYLAADAADVATDSGASDSSTRSSSSSGCCSCSWRPSSGAPDLNQTSHRRRRPSGWPRSTP